MGLGRGGGVEEIPGEGFVGLDEIPVGDVVYAVKTEAVDREICHPSG